LDELFDETVEEADSEVNVKWNLKSKRMNLISEKKYKKMSKFCLTLTR
jgi:hypothetical protein